MKKVSILKNDFVNCEVVEFDFYTLCGLVTKYRWSQSVYKDNYRLLKNFQKTSLIALDIDEELSLKDAIERFQEYKHIIATTKSHQKEKNGKVLDRFRIILFLESEIDDPEIYKSTWRYLQGLCPESDKQCKDPSRYWEPSSSIVSKNENGKLVPIVLNSSISEKMETKVKIENNFNFEEKLSKSTLLLIAMGANKGERNANLYKAARDVQQQGGTIDWALENLPLRLISESFSEEEAMRTIYSAFKTEPEFGMGDKSFYDLKKKFQDGVIVRNLKDPSEVILLDKNERREIHASTISDILNRKEVSLQKSIGKYRYANFIYNPYIDEILSKGDSGIDVYNRYRKPEWQLSSVKGNNLPSIYNEFLEHLTGGNKESFDYILDWLSTMVKERNFTILCTIGTQGIGKGILGEIMEKLVGNGNFVKCRDTVLKTQFNGHIEGKRLVYIDEIDIKGSKTSHDRIKDLVNPKLELERKGKDPLFVDNFASIYLSSNSLDSIRLAAGNRRFSIVELTDKKLVETPLNGRVDSEILNYDNIILLGKYLENHQIKYDMKKPFTDSERYKEVLEAGNFNWEDCAVNDWAINNPGVEVTLKKFQEILKERSVGRFTPPGRPKLEELAKKYPDRLKVFQRGTERFVKSMCEPKKLTDEDLKQVDELLEKSQTSNKSNVANLSS